MNLPFVSMKKTALVLLLCLFALQLFSTNLNMIVSEYSTENGLSHNTVFCSLKDNDGLMWFGTWYGLTYFDAAKFKSFNTINDNNTDIPPHKVQNIIEAKDGNLWVKTIDHKLYLFDKTNELFYDVFNEIKKKYSVSPKIIKIQKADDGNLLLLTKDRDLLIAQSKGNGIVAITLLYDSQIRRDQKFTNNLLVENKDYLNWIGLDFKIISCKKGTSLKSKPSDFFIRKITLENGQEFSSSYALNNVLWLGDNKGNLFKINSKDGTVIKKTLLAGAIIQNIIVSNNNTLFVSLGKNGVYEFDERTSNFTKILPLGNLTITSSYIDSYDKLWLETTQSSYIYYDPFNGTSKQILLPEGKVRKEIKLIDGKELGMFFLSTSGDITWFDRTNLSVSILNNQSDLTKNGEKKVFFDVLLDKDNILWLSSTTNGVCRISFPKKQFTLFNLPSSAINDDAIKAISQSRNGDIWVSTRQAEVFKLDKNGAIKQLFSAGNNSIGSVYHIMEDHKGNLWFSTKGNGLVFAEINPLSPTGYNFTRFVTDEKNPFSISGNDIYYTYEDTKHRIWIAAFGGGINLITQENGKIQFKNKFNSFSNYPKYGLYMEARNIVEDKEGRIWIGTSDGLMSLDGQFKNPDETNFEIYRNGKLGSNVSDNDIYSIYKDANSQIWFSAFGGGLNKITEYDKKEKRPIFKSYGQKEGLNSDVILSIVEDNQNNLWLATENAISRFDKQKETFRNFDQYDGLMKIQMEEESAVKLNSGNLWFGSRRGILIFNPQKIETYNFEYKTFIVDFKVSNRDLDSFKDNPILKESIRYAKQITLKHNQSTFLIEFAALNYYNQSSISYKYILEGFEKEWHFNGKNRIASYPNIPSGKYTFRVQAIDEANPSLISESILKIRILPPWWRSWWANIFYFILTLILIYFIIRGVLFYIKLKNEMYVEQRVSELKIRFFTNISHELRTPLTLIMGPIHELKEKQTLTEKGQQYVSLIEKNANQMLQLVNQILDFRKIQNGKMILHVAQLDLNSLVESFNKEFNILAEENGIHFSLRLSHQNILLWADKEKLEIAIRNLLSNAFKFTHKGGKVTLSTHLSEDKKHCIIGVNDTGVGIPQNKLTEIFDRFFQGENAKNVQYPGTGIGLALSKEIVNMHQGEIHVESKQNKGSTFSIELPLDKDHFNPKEVNFYVSDTVSEKIDEKSEMEKTPDETQENTKNLPILLVVEDNKDLCTLLQLQLEDRYKVYTATNGVEGLKKVYQHHPDIVVSDLMMPEMNGMELLDKMRNDFQISHIPIVILTAKSNEEAKIEAIGKGANAYITKPFNKEHLIVTIEQLLTDRKVFHNKIWNEEKPEKPRETDTYESYLEKKDLQFIEKIHQIIDENIDNSDFNVDSIADTLGISRSAFFKKLKSLTGLAPVDMIKEVRLTKSIELLKIPI